MSRNGSGTYNLPAGNPVVTGTTITTSWANTTLSDIASTLTASIATDGQTPMAGALNMANNKVISVSDPTNAQDAATKAYVDAADATNLALTLLKANNLSDVASASTSRTNLGLGTIATQAANSVSITGGSITGITDLAVADGGTGSSTLSANAVLLGNGTSALQTVAPSTSGNILTSNGTTWTSASQAGLGYNQTWQDVASSRALGTTYTNSTGAPIMVSIGVSYPSGANSIRFRVGSITVGYESGNSTTDVNDSVTFIVQNGQTYIAEIVSGSVSVVYWSELR